MRLVATLASLAIVAAAAVLPASLVTIVGERAHTIRADDTRESDDARHASESVTSEPEEDDDLDERLGQTDELVAVLAAVARPFVPSSAETSWPVHEACGPRAPHPEDTLRPPIAA